MASSSYDFQSDDQTDEDFFDKLVDGEFDDTESKSKEILRGFSNLSIGIDSVESESNEEVKFKEKDENSDVLILDSNDNEAVNDAKNDLIKQSSVKEVQWGAFSVDSFNEEFGSSEFSIENSNFTIENSNAFIENPVDNVSSNVGFVEQQCFFSSATELTKDQNDHGESNLTEKSDILNLDSYLSIEKSGSFGSNEVEIDAKSDISKGTTVKEVQWSTFSADGSQEFEKISSFEPYSEFPTEGSNGFVDSFSSNVSSVEQQYDHSNTSECTEDQNDPQYWEKIYPGWKYDSISGQWYQVDSDNATTNTQSDYSTSLNYVSENMGVAYSMHQTSQPVLETIEEENITSSVSNINNGSQGIVEYPANMVFDPQYPEWYYDTDTQQWYTLESYNQVIVSSSNSVQDVSSEQNNFLYSNVHVEGNQEAWDTSMDSYDQKNSLNNNSYQSELTSSQVWGSQEFGHEWNASINNHDQQKNMYSNISQPEQQTNQNQASKGIGENWDVSKSTYAQPNMWLPHPLSGNVHTSSLSNSYYSDQATTNYPHQSFNDANNYNSQFSYAPSEGRSSAGRPPHALVTFGFGGKLIIMKTVNSAGANFDYGSQENGSNVISVLKLLEVVTEKSDYIHALCQSSFPGPLVGGSAAAKDVNKWIDEKIGNSEYSSTDFQKAELSKLLFSLLKIMCQHYGKLRSPFGADLSLEDTNGPDSAVTKLFSAAKKNGARLTEFSSPTHCMQNIPSEGQIQATAIEVKNLLVSGRRKDALQYAQDGQLWGPALVLASQLGDKFYVDTVKKMAQCQFASGSPLRTLCLLIAGQPADVFSNDISASSFNGASMGVLGSTQVIANGMLDDWEENLAIITANRTKDDELVIIHLGDCLYKERGEIIAAHTCYLVAEASFESYSDSSRLCLIGGDHWNCPRTYSSPEAIQRTEVYEYSKVLGNSQIVLLPFQPYKLIYAYMLAEVGKVSDSLRYCQALLKLLKTPAHAPEVEMWKTLLASLEERLRTHQQGGYSSNLAPAKLVGKFITSLDRSINRMIGSPPTTLPPVPQNSANSKENFSIAASKVASTQSTMTMSSLMPSASVEAISERSADGNRTFMHNRSISEPDFGRNPKPNSTKDAGSSEVQNNSSNAPSKLGRFGSQFFQKTIGWVSKSRQAKLGETNKFYYDEKLKRWVEEGAEPPAEEIAPPPPPKAPAFQNGSSDYTINSAFKNQIPPNGVMELKTPVSSEHNSGIPPIPLTQNQFSARGRVGVRSRYVDTFNKGSANSSSGMLTSSFQSPITPIKPTVNTKFFVPTPCAPSDNTQQNDAMGEINQEHISNCEPSTLSTKESKTFLPSSSSSSISPPPSSISPPPSMQRFPSLDNISPYTSPSVNGPLSYPRAASWSGSYSDASSQKFTPFLPQNSSSTHTSSNSSQQLNGNILGDELQEVEL